MLEHIAAIRGWDIGRWPGEFGWVYQASCPTEDGFRTTIPLSVPIKEPPSRDQLEQALIKAISHLSHTDGG